MVKKTVAMAKPKTPVIQPILAPRRADSSSPVFLRYRYAARKPEPTRQTSIQTRLTYIGIGREINKEEMAAASSPTLTAVRFRKLISPGPGTAGGAPAGVAMGAGGPSSSSSDGGVSNCGFPHLWQKRASGGNSAPQVQ